MYIYIALTIEGRWLQNKKKNHQNTGTLKYYK